MEGGLDASGFCERQFRTRYVHMSLSLHLTIISSFVSHCYYCPEIAQRSNLYASLPYRNLGSHGGIIDLSGIENECLFIKAVQLRKSAGDLECNDNLEVIPILTLTFEHEHRQIIFLPLLMLRHPDDQIILSQTRTDFQKPQPMPSNEFFLSQFHFVSDHKNNPITSSPSYKSNHLIPLNL